MFVCVCSESSEALGGRSSEVLRQENCFYETETINCSLAFHFWKGVLALPAPKVSALVTFPVAVTEYRSHSRKDRFVLRARSITGQRTQRQEPGELVSCGHRGKQEEMDQVWISPQAVPSAAEVGRSASMNFI